MSYRQSYLSENEEQCTSCDSDTDIVIHHVDGDRTNNDPDNLVSVCRSCHTKIHVTPNPDDDRIAELQAQLEDPPTESTRAQPTTIRFEPQELGKLDAEAEERGFSSRTDYLRYIIRNRDSLDQNTADRLDELESRLEDIEAELGRR